MMKAGGRRAETPAEMEADQVPAGWLAGWLARSEAQGSTGQDSKEESQHHAVEVWKKHGRARRSKAWRAGARLRKRSSEAGRGMH